MSKKVLKIGSSHGVTVSQELLGKIGVKLGDAVDITYNRKKDVLEIANSSKPQPVSKYLARVNKLIEENHDALKRLSDEW